MTSRVASIAFGALLVAAAGFLLHATRGTTLWFDEWQWALDRGDNSAAALLDPHNGHLSLVPVAIYKLLFATVGLDEHGPYRATVIGCSSTRSRAWGTSSPCSRRR